MEAHCTCAGLVPNCSLHIKCSRIKLIIIIGESKLFAKFMFANSQSYPPRSSGLKQKMFIEFMYVSMRIQCHVST